LLVCPARLRKCGSSSDPEAKDAPGHPAFALQRPGERRCAPAEQDRMPAVRGAASRGEQDAVADRCDRQAGSKEFADELLQCLALQILAHAACAVTAGENQTIELFASRLAPGERRLERGILLYRGVGRACRRVRAHEAADGGEAPQTRYEAPQVQAFAGE